MNTPVSFELAKMLKEKGFDKPCIACYDKCDMLSSYVENVFELKNYNTCSFVKSAPTIAEVVMWLYDKYGIWVVVDNLIDNKFYFSHRDTKTNNYASRSGCNEEGYESPTEAYEAAILYTLKNLI